MFRRLFVVAVSISSLFVTACGKNETRVKPSVSTAAAKRSMAPANSCLLQIAGTCANYPAYTNYNGLDNDGMKYANAGLDAAVCARRAQDFYDGCGKSAPVATTFTNTGVQTKVGGNVAANPLVAGYKIVEVTNFNNYGFGYIDAVRIRLGNGTRLYVAHNPVWRINTVVTGTTIAALAPGMRIFYTAARAPYFNIFCGGNFCDGIAQTIQLAQ